MRIAGAAFDTLLAAYLLEAGERNLGLTETALRHDLIPADAVADAATTGLDRPTAPADAARHCAIVGQLADLLPARLAAAGLEPLYRDVELPLAGVLADMECRGVRIDTAALAAL
jgi:DNA polymerase-1